MKYTHRTNKLFIFYSNRKEVNEIHLEANKKKERLKLTNFEKPRF